MNRRSFLLAVGATSAYAIAPSFRLIDPNESLRSRESVLFEYMRELGQYSPDYNTIFVRWDAFAGGVQIGVDTAFDYTADMNKLRKQVASTRPVAANAIRLEMEKRGARFADLRALEIPHGHVNPWDRELTGSRLPASPS